MPLKEEIETKFLGVTIDNELTWQSHIDNVYKKLKPAAGMLAHIPHNIPQKTIKHFTLHCLKVIYLIASQCLATQINNTQVKYLLFKNTVKEFFLVIT